MKAFINIFLVIFLLFVALIGFLGNFNVGTIVILFFGLIFCFWRYMRDNVFFRLLKRLTVIGMMVFIIGICFIAVSGNSTSTLDEEAVIVLGCAVHGYAPSNTLIMRLNKCIEYSNINKKAVIVVSGGQGPQEKISEAQAMYNYLISKGVDKNRIIVEDKSTATSENFINSKIILDKYFGNENYRVCFITNHFHTYRAGELAEINNIKATSYSAKTPATAVPTCYIREVMAVVKLWLFKS